MPITMMNAESNAPAQSIDELSPPAIAVPPPAPTPVIDQDQLRQLGQWLGQKFNTYKSNRVVAEQRWLRNQRQMLGIYDPDVEKTLAANRSKAYPRITRVKAISILSRIMNLMFPGNEDNWDLQASPSPDMSPEDVSEAIQKWMRKQQEAGLLNTSGNGPIIEDEDIEMAVQELANDRAQKLKDMIKDQLQELGGDQTLDYIALNRKALLSGITYGMGILIGPFAREVQKTKWIIDPMTGMPSPTVQTSYKPMFEFLPIWDFYPDMAAKTLATMDGHFKRRVMSRAQVRRLADRPDFFGDVIKRYLKDNQQGNYRAQLFETELRTMGVKVNVNEQGVDGSKYEIIIWNGSVSARQLQQCGVDIPEEFLGDEVDAEVWMIDNYVIKAAMNPWAALGVDVRTFHPFIFEEDDTSPVGSGLPNVMRDSQMMVAAATRMLLDNASITCGPNIELNTTLLRADQDLTSIAAYKIWYRDDDGMTAQWPSVRNVAVDSHMNELTEIIKLGLQFADQETFVNPATGGDVQRMPSEPMRTAAGASMLRGDQALPFKDIIRNFDSFTQSIIYSLVQFNRKFNPGPETEGDFNVIARGATSLIAKEIRGAQLDQLAVTLTPEERMELNEREMLRERLMVRDCERLILPDSEAKRKRMQAQQQQAEQAAMQKEFMEAQIREFLSSAYKNITQGQKNSAAADVQNVEAVLKLLEQGLNDGGQQPGQEGGTGEGASEQARQSGPFGGA